MYNLHSHKSLSAARPCDFKVSAAAPLPREPVLPQAHRPTFRVLQTARAPAQLSLFLRAGAAPR